MAHDPEDPDLAADLAEHLGEGNDNAFDPLALRVFARQWRLNKPYRAFCDGRGASPATVHTWREIPAAPAAAFKRFALTCAPEEDCTPERGGRVFHSSGTTGAETSRHFLDLPAADLYRKSLLRSYRHFVCPDGRHLPIAALMASPREAPHSSLSFMVAELLEDGDGGAFYAGGGWQGRAAAELGAMTTPVVVFGTAFAFVHLFDWLADQEIALNLPEHSRVVETGGFKGRSREVSREELYSLFTERLGVPATHCLSEYGMSEMASQFYDTTLLDHVNAPQAPHGPAERWRAPRKSSLPHLLRTRVIDPVTGEEAVPGQPGVLAHYDLCNLNSVLGIQTEDYGHACEDGDGFVLLGRAPGTALRGCSLTAEEMQAAVSRSQNA